MDSGIGFITKQTINKLYQEGDIRDSIFFEAVRNVLTCAVCYILVVSIIREELLTHATWLDFEQKLQKSFHSVEYFVQRFPHIFPTMDMERLNEE